MVRKKSSLGIAACAFAMAGASGAYATDFVIGPQGSNFFITSGMPASGPITAIFYNSFNSTTWFDDRFLFTVPRQAIGSGSISTSFSDPNNSLVIVHLYINGIEYVVPATSSGQSTSVGGIVILKNVLNVIEVMGYTTGANGYSGTATVRSPFIPGGIPEAANWMMMLGGFGIIGALMRRRRARLAFAL